MLRWFESTSSHQNEILSRSISFLFYINLYNKLRWWIRTARVRRFASRRTKTPLRGVFRARLGGFTSSHQNETLSRSVSFLFYINIVTSCAGGFEQPVSDALRPVGQKYPLRGVFRARLGGFNGSHQNEVLFRMYLVFLTENQPVLKVQIIVHTPCYTKDNKEKFILFSKQNGGIYYVE